MQKRDERLDLKDELEKESNKVGGVHKLEERRTRTQKLVVRSGVWRTAR